MGTDLSGLQAKLMGLRGNVGFAQQGLREKASGELQRLEEALANLEMRLLGELGCQAAQINAFATSQGLQVEAGTEAQANLERFGQDIEAYEA